VTTQLQLINIIIIIIIATTTITIITIVTISSPFAVLIFRELHDIPH